MRISDLCEGSRLTDDPRRGVVSREDVIYIGCGLISIIVRCFVVTAAAVWAQGALAGGAIPIHFIFWTDRGLVRPGGCRSLVASGSTGLELFVCYLSGRVCEQNWV